MPIRFLIAIFSVLPASAQAASTTSYTYDALGRLVNSITAGTINNGTQMSITYDAADNRTTYRVTGSVQKVVVVPLNDLTVIPVQD
ncbi:hypothetical protein DM806_03150 [Sphingobium lactosutens]|uniref:hypothetical protein n=1 Tax=Sphingobium lactosutens TaxID=522773 RepID=UPI0015BBA911|nr:hypothetical protein [Sphingobium lactosutens]NWK94678.1 hypothetical protein [Sphingobium lactosutens]